jgi:hypothetical protein
MVVGMRGVAVAGRGRLDRQRRRRGRAVVGEAVVWLTSRLLVALSGGGCL